MAKSQATTMKIRNRNGLIHAAFSAFDTAEGPFASATPRSLVTRFHRQINPLDKYCLGGFPAAISLRIVVETATRPLFLIPPPHLRWGGWRAEGPSDGGWLRRRDRSGQNS